MPRMDYEDADFTVFLMRQRNRVKAKLNAWERDHVKRRDEARIKALLELEDDVRRAPRAANRPATLQDL